MKQLFIYGSLMFDAVWRQVVGASVNKEAAMLQGYQCQRVCGESYPALQRKIGSLVEGQLVRCVTRHMLRKLDRFEGRQYRRVTVTVLIADQRRVRCETYLLKPRYRHLLSGQAWDATRFEEQHLHQFLRCHE